MKNKTIIIVTISLLVVVLIAVLLLINRDRDQKDLAKNIDALIESEQFGRLSPSGEDIKRILISSFFDGAGVLLANQSMEIGYLPPPNERIMVFVLANEVERTEEEAINWLLSRGFSRTDLCNFPVVFSIDSPQAVTDRAYKLMTNYIPEYCLVGD